MATAEVEMTTLENHWTGERVDVPVAEVHRGPPIEVGEFVNWYMEGNTHAAPRVAMVEKTNDLAIEVVLLAADTWGSRVKGVHHWTDPELEQRPQLARNNGCWEYTENHKAAMAEKESLLLRIGVLERQVAELAESLTAPKKKKVE